MGYIKGNYRKTIYRSEKGYVIGIFKVRDTNLETMKEHINKTVTFTGFFHDLNEDDTYIFHGEDTNHPRYGFQFEVKEYERVKPEDKDGIIDFLCSDLFPGIGENMAKTIVERLGDNALEEIIKDPSCLTLIPKLSTKKAKVIYDNLMKYEESHKTIVYLTELGFSMKDALNIYNQYKYMAIAKIEHNIYSIMDDIKDISFLKLDEIASKQNIDPNDERRVKATIIYIMNKLLFQNGDTHLEYDEIYKSTNEYLRTNIDRETLDMYLDSLVEESRIVIENNMYYTKEMWQAENNIVGKLYKLVTKTGTKYKNLDKEIEALEYINEIKYDAKQKLAIKKALEENVVIITGGPGTGKTTIIKAIVELYQNLNKFDYEELVEYLALLAPTGRASKRMSESTMLPASTIHRFLKWNKENESFGINEYNKDYSQLIIVDEVSMIDINLLDSLFKGLTDNIKLILVGDYNQLPSVGSGQILKDLIDSDVIDVVHLDLLYRQNEESYIPVLAEEIKNDDLSENFTDQRSDYSFIECSSTQIKPSLKVLCEQIIKKGFDERKIQLMAPLYRGENGIDNLNILLQDIFNPKSDSKKEITYADVTFRENDKILQLVNMPEENIYNGDIGFIKHIIYASNSISKKNEIYIDFDGNVVKYTPKDLVKIKHGYIITIHKSQGSEFDMVIVPVCNSYKRMLYRKLIYTGITRAKKKLILLGEKDAFIYSVNNNEEYIRKTNLMNKLIDKINS